MNPKKLSDCIENSDNRKHWRPSRSAGAADTELRAAAPEKAAEKLDRDCCVLRAHGL